MSFSKEFTLHNKWVNDALKYAAKHNVVVVRGAGNDSIDLDHKNSYTYPKDTNSLGKEFVDNFITVGGNTKHTNEKFVSSFTNYGKQNVESSYMTLAFYSIHQVAVLLHC